MRITVFITVLVLCSVVHAQNRHYDFPQLLLGQTPQPPTSLEAAANLSEHQPKHLWRVGKLVMKADTDASKLYLLAMGSDTNANNLTPTKSQGKQIAAEKKLADRTLAKTGGVTQADIKKMSMAEKLAFAEKMRGMNAQSAQAPSMHEEEVIGNGSTKFGPAIGMMNDLYHSLDSLRESLDARHSQIDVQKAKELENCPKVKDHGTAESAPATPCENAAYEKARVGHRDLENAGLATASGMIEAYKQRLMPYLQEAMDIENQLKDGNAIRTEAGKEQYRLFLGNVMQTIGAVMHNTVTLVEHADKWEPMS